ncbi:hypothetical protein ACFL5V_08350 [Fibrobacterota bacterium]
MKTFLRLAFPFLLFVTWSQQAPAEEFAGEVYLMPFSVPVNGTAGNIPASLNAPSQFIAFPADMGRETAFNVEMATLPIFGGLSEVFSAGALFPLDANTEIGVFGAMVPAEEIYTCSEQSTTAEQRAADPVYRPLPCAESGTELKNVAYLAYMNIKRRYTAFLPRTDFSTNPVPLVFTFGTNVKYFKDELEGLYIAHNVNLDLALNIQLIWGADPVNHTSNRNFTLDFSGFELLQNSQASSFAKEKIPSRYHLGFYWDENVPKLISRVRLGVQQKPEWGEYPGLGAEWQFRKILSLRSGFHSEYIAGGLSLQYGFFSIHYTLAHHYLALSPYQVSIQIIAPLF